MARITRDGLLVLLTLALSARALDGIAVTTRAGRDDVYGDKMEGQLWRIDVAASAATKATQLVASGAGREVINPAGTKVAFVRTAGGVSKLCVIGINGGAVTELSTCNKHAIVDFPSDDWIYFSGGGFNEWQTSGVIKRVSPNGGAVQDVVTLKFEDPGTVTAGIAQMQISRDLTRMAVRTDDRDAGPAGQPSGTIVRYNLAANDGILRKNMVTSPPWSCGMGFASDGSHVFDGWGGHDGWDVFAWDGTLVKSLSSGGHEIFSVGSATNHPDWIVYNNHGVQRLKNWRTGETFTTGEGDAGDFWVGAPSSSPGMLLSPAALAFSAQQGGANPAPQSVTITNSGGGTLDNVTTAVTYGQGGGWLAVTRGGSGNSQTLANAVTVGALAAGTYQASVKVTAANAQPPEATYTVTLTVSAATARLASVTVTPAAADINVYGQQRFEAAAKDQNGQPLAGATIAWSVSGGRTIDAATGVFTAGPAPGGPYTVSATATHGGVSVTGTAQVSVAVPLTVTSPAAGAVVTVGQPLTVRWSIVPERTTDGLAIDLSPDDGVSWYLISGSAAIRNGDTKFYSGNNGSWTWTVAPSVTLPDNSQQPVVSDKCRIRVNSPYARITTVGYSGLFSIKASAAVTAPQVSAAGRANGVTVRLSDGRLAVRDPGRGFMRVTVSDLRGRRTLRAQGSATVDVDAGRLSADAQVVRVEHGGRTSVVRLCDVGR